MAGFWSEHTRIDADGFGAARPTAVAVEDGRHLPGAGFRPEGDAARVEVLVAQYRSWRSGEGGQRMARRLMARRSRQFSGRAPVALVWSPTLRCPAVSVARRA